MRTCQALVLVAMTGAALLSPGMELQAEEKQTAEWVDMSYAVTKSDYQNLFSLPPIRTSPEFSAEVIVKPGSKTSSRSLRQALMLFMSARRPIAALRRLLPSVALTSPTCARVGSVKKTSMPLI